MKEFSKFSASAVLLYSSGAHKYLENSMFDKIMPVLFRRNLSTISAATAHRPISSQATEYLSHEQTMEVVMDFFGQKIKPGESMNLSGTSIQHLQDGSWQIHYCPLDLNGVPSTVWYNRKGGITGFSNNRPYSGKDLAEARFEWGDITRTTLAAETTLSGAEKDLAWEYTNDLKALGVKLIKQMIRGV